MTGIFSVIEINDDGILIAQMENVKHYIFISHGLGACLQTCWTAYPNNIKHKTYINVLQYYIFTPKNNFSFVSYSNLNNYLPTTVSSQRFSFYFKNVIKWL